MTMRFAPDTEQLEGAPGDPATDGATDPATHGARDTDRVRTGAGEPPVFFRHPQAIVETTRVGRGTRVWAFAHVLPGAVIGADCNVCDGVFVENDVVIGDRVTIKCGVQVWDGIVLEDDVFVGPNVTFTNDPWPRSRTDFALRRTVVRRGASLGANATFLPGVTIGRRAMVGAGAVVTADVPPFAIVVGNPARVVGFVDDEDRRLAVVAPAPESAPLPTLRAAGARLMRLPQRVDGRGALAFGEYGEQLPFLVRRYFLITQVPPTAVRGGHAHHEAREVMVAVNGSCHVVLDDGTVREEVVLDDPTVALHVPPNIWRTMYRYSPGAALLVLCSDEYREADYVRDYNEFVHLVGAR